MAVEKAANETRMMEAILRTCQKKSVKWIE